MIKHHNYNIQYAALVNPAYRIEVDLESTAYDPWQRIVNGLPVKTQPSGTLEHDKLSQSWIIAGSAS